MALFAWIWLTKCRHFSNPGQNTGHTRALELGLVSVLALCVVFRWTVTWVMSARASSRCIPGEGPGTILVEPWKSEWCGVHEILIWVMSVSLRMRGLYKRYSTQSIKWFYPQLYKLSGVLPETNPTVFLKINLYLCEWFVTSTLVTSWQLGELGRSISMRDIHV
jgi:hypothetical protein